MTLQIVASVSKSREAAKRRMLNTETNIDRSSSNVVSEENDFLTQKEQQKIFSDFLATRRRDERRIYRTQQRLLQHEMLSNFKEEIKPNEEPENDYNNDEISYGFNDEASN